MNNMFIGLLILSFVEKAAIAVSIASVLLFIVCLFGYGISSADFPDNPVFANTVRPYFKKGVLTIVVATSIACGVPSLDTIVRIYIYSEASKLANAEKADELIKGTVNRIDQVMDHFLGVKQEKKNEPTK